MPLRTAGQGKPTPSCTRNAHPKSTAGHFPADTAESVTGALGQRPSPARSQEPALEAHCEFMPANHGKLNLPGCTHEYRAWMWLLHQEDTEGDTWASQGV